VVVAAGVSAEVADAARLTGRRPGPATLEEETWALAGAGRALSSRDLVSTLAEIHQASRAIARFFEAHDLLLTSTLALPPLPIGAVRSSALERAGMRAVGRLRSRRLFEKLLSEIGGRSFDATGNTMLFNQTGQPAMSLPLHWAADGIPIGVQLAGRFGDEATLFRLAAQLEAARPWAGRAPPP
jgi:amidase